MALNVGLAGAGGISRAHLSALASLSSIHVAGLFDADRSRAEQRAAEHGVERVYGSWAEMLADPGVDVIGVLLPHHLHRQYAVEALEAGKHVVCEKPLAVDLGECDAMLDAARRAKRRLFPVHNRIYARAYERMRELLHQGAIGEAFLAQTNGYEGPEIVEARSWLADRRSGGVLLAQAVHPAYALRWLLGEVEQVSCAYARSEVVAMAAEHTAVATLWLASGAVGVMTATFGMRAGPYDHSITLSGDAGQLDLHVRRGDSAHVDVLQVVSSKLYGDRATHEVEVTDPDGHGGTFRRMWEDYARSIEAGVPARVGDVDGRKAVEIVLAARLSAELGRPVRLPL